MILSAALIAGLAPAAGASVFLEALHRAAARDARDPERVEFATRAIRAWTPADGQTLLADAYFRRGEGEFEGFADDAAARDLAKTLELDGGNDRALLLRASALLRAGRAAQAEKDFLSCTERRADDGEGWLGLAEARLALGRARAGRPALDAAARAAALLPAGDPRPALAEGRSRLASGLTLKALDAFERAAAAAGPFLADALAWRARAKAELGDAQGARADGGRAAELLEARLGDRRRSNAPAPAVDAAKADLADARVRRGRAEETLSLPDDAREDYRLACALGRADACARERALTPRATAPAPNPRKPRRRRNPSSDAGTRIYAN
jgi:hypothetical protein